MLAAIYNNRGEITRFINAPSEAIEPSLMAGESFLEVEDDSLAYVENGELIPFPEKPSPYHDWDWITKSWLPNPDAARAAKKTEINTELIRRLYLPCNGFDADMVSRERISGMISRLHRGDGLPVKWAGWRDASNQMYWSQETAESVLVHLTALSKAIEDREQSLLISSWTHKANIEALTSVESLLSYNINEGWDE